ncbi:MAG: DUF1549 and DUF1553 domain-containing protein [Pirellulales bacterium]|nr:DUF1549 and DUF1553 domain-containing protein [Pirellulales bacterium]
MIGRHLHIDVLALRRRPAACRRFVAMSLIRLAGTFCLIATLSSSVSANTESLHARIDQLVAARMPTEAAPPATDSEFVRRVYLDLTGCIPSTADARAFIDSSDSGKRTALIERLLASPQYARRMQVFFDLVWMERRPEKNVPNAEWTEYLRASFAAGKPYDQLVREILSADGTDPTLRPAMKFYLDRDGDRNLVTRDIGRLFLGRDLQCAQCHDHPLIDDYKQEHYYGLLAFWNRSSIFTDKANQKYIAEKADGEVSFKSVFLDEQPRSTPPRLPDSPMPEEPKFNAGEEYVVAPADGVRPVPKYSRRAKLAPELTSAERRDFRRNIVNRLWALMFGRGLVDPVDLHHAANPPSHPELLDLLADEFAGASFDVRWLLRELALTAAYQRASDHPSIDPNQLPPESYCVALLKPLSPEQLGWSVLEASGVSAAYRAGVEGELAADTKFAQLLDADEKRQRQRLEISERRFYERLAPSLGEFVNLFGGPPGSPAQGFQATVHQALFFDNGGTIRSWLVPSGQNLLARAAALPDSSAQVEEIYLTVLTRRPDVEERTLAVDALNARPAAERPAALEELAWALLASAEFRLNH